MLAMILGVGSVAKLVVTERLKLEGWAGVRWFRRCDFWVSPDRRPKVVVHVPERPCVTLSGPV